MASSDRQSGFALVETLVSFAILALVLTVMLGGISRMATGGRHAEVMLEALRLAQTKLDSVGITEPLSPGESTGRFDNGFQWRVQVSAPASPGTTRTYGAWIVVAVFPPNERARTEPRISLTTFRLTEGASP
jgi:type II secretory pathway pseudopilin PulG